MLEWSRWQRVASAAGTQTRQEGIPCLSPDPAPCIEKQHPRYDCRAEAPASIFLARNFAPRAPFGRLLETRQGVLHERIRRAGNDALPEKGDVLLQRRRLPRWIRTVYHRRCPHSADPHLRARCRLDRSLGRLGIRRHLRRHDPRWVPNRHHRPQAHVHST